MVAMKGEFSKYAASKGADPIRLGRWNYVHLVNGEKSCELSLHVNVFDHIQHLAQCIVNNEDSS